jgi:hypothetical protein
MIDLDEAGEDINRMDPGLAQKCEELVLEINALKPQAKAIDQSIAHIEGELQNADMSRTEQLHKEVLDVVDKAN